MLSKWKGSDVRATVVQGRLTMETYSSFMNESCSKTIHLNTFDENLHCRFEYFQQAIFPLSTQDIFILQTVN